MSEYLTDSVYLFKNNRMPDKAIFIGQMEVILKVLETPLTENELRADTDFLWEPLQTASAVRKLQGYGNLIKRLQAVAKTEQTYRRLLKEEQKSDAPQS